MSHCVSPGKTGERGAALVMVLWLTLIVSLLAGAFALTVTTEAGRQSARVRSAQARATLDTALAAVLVMEMAPRPGRRPPNGGWQEMTLSDPAARVSWSVQDQAGLIDLNRTPVERLRALLPALADRMAFPVLSEIETRRATGRPFLSVQELAAIPGMPEATQSRLLSALTVHQSANSGKVAILAAPSILLDIWPDLTPTDRAALRNLTDGGRGPGEPKGEPRGELVRRLNRAGLRVNARPSPFRAVRLRVALDNGANAAAEVLVWLNADDAAPFRILEWRPLPEEMP